MADRNDNPELRQLIQTLHSFIFVVTEEEGRFIQWLKEEYAGRKRHKLRVWRQSKGLMDITDYVALWENFNETTLRPDNTADPNQFLLRMLSENTPMDRTYTVILGCEHMLSGRDPMMTRRLMDLAEQAAMNRQSFKSVIFVGSHLTLPSGMERYFRVTHFELPTSEMHREILDGILGSDQLVRKLKSNIEIDACVRAFAGMTHYECEQTILACLTLHRDLKPDMIRDVKREIIKKNPLLELIPPQITFEDIGGMSRLKAYLARRKNAWTEEGKKYGLPRFRGILQVGLPGNGKSLSCKALAHEYGIPLVKFDPAKLFAGQVGSSESNMRSALTTLEKMAPCVAWIDEVEKGLAGMQSSTFSDSGTTARVIGSFLTWMQECDEDVILMATANDVKNLPPELLRRFDEIFFVGLPEMAQRREIWDIHIRKVGRDPKDFDIEQLAASSERRSGAEIEVAVGEALYVAFDDGGREVTTDDMKEAVEGKPPIVVTMREQLDEIIEWVGKDDESGDGVRARFAHALNTDAAGMKAV